MIITTTPTIEGHNIVAYKGIVTSETIFGANWVRDTLAHWHDFFGGRSSEYEEVLNNGQPVVLTELEQRAIALGANAIIGVSMDYETVGPNATMLMIYACGTAVVID